MSAMLKIQSAGFILKLVNGNLNVTPTKEALTDNQRQYLKSHKAEIITELQKQQPCNDEAIQFIKCHDCLHFKCFNQHGGGAGTCLAGVQSNGAAWWSETEHECAQFDPSVEWIELLEPKPDAIMVVCYSPNGAAFEVEATSPEHADWLVKMNQKRVTP